MNIDMYGSRYTLIPILNKGSDYNINLENVYLGSNLESQFSKVTKLNKTYIKNKFTKYDYLEQLTDLQKTFRRFSGRSENNVIIIDFMMESKMVSLVNNVKLTDSLLLKYSLTEDIKEQKNLSLTNKFNNLVKLMDNFIKLLNHYDLVILNKVKLSDYAIDQMNEDELINFKLQETIIELCESLLIKMCNNIVTIPFIYEDDNFKEKYLFDKVYQEHLINSLNTILENAEMK